MSYTVHYLRRKNSASDVRFSLCVQTVDRNLFSHGAQLDAADCKFSLDGGGLANTANQVQESPAGSGLYTVTITAVELNGSFCLLKVVDATGNAWMDLTVIIETYDIYPNPLQETEVAEITAGDLAATMPFDKILGLLKNRFLMLCEQTATTQTVYKADNATPVATGAVSYDGVTQSRTRGY